MEIIELTKENIETYLEDCIDLQEYLVSDKNTINAEYFTQTAHDDHAYFLGILEERKIIGMGLVSKVIHPVTITGYINNIVVHPDARGQGLFGRIMDTLEAKAKQWGCQRIELTCSREAVQGMYEKREYVHKDTHFYIKKI